MMAAHSQRKKISKKILLSGLLFLLLLLVAVFIWQYGCCQQALKVVGSQQHLSVLLRRVEHQQSFSQQSLWQLLLSPLLLPAAALFSLANGYMAPLEFRPVNYYQDMRFDKSSPLATEVMSASGVDYATTNLQVANVDEADIVKTDGNYLYSLSESQVIITDVRQPQVPKIAAKLNLTNAGIPEDLFLFENLLAIIGTNPETLGSIVNIYDCREISEPKLVKQFTLSARYFTARISNGKLYVLAKHYLSSDNFSKNLAYSDDAAPLAIAYHQLHYLPDSPTNDFSVVATLDLHSLGAVQVNGYLFDLQQAYVSPEHLYLITQDRKDNTFSLRDFATLCKSLFTYKGVWGMQLNSIRERDYHTYSKVYKFKLAEELVFIGKLTTQGKSLNQFSFDEDSEGNFRLALNYWQDSQSATKIEIYNQHLRLLGSLANLAPGEQMYAARFMGKRVYLVTYKTIDPLFVIDLSNPHSPKVLGELKIPGYSTYLHSYDDNHLLGFGIETTERIARDDQGRVLGASATREKVKIALFDVSNVAQPKELATTTIGDSHTTSSVLTNHKALLFSREKNLLAIPVNNYYSHASSLKQTAAEGYWVYYLNLRDGFKFKGEIVHDDISCQSQKLLRGVYIRDNLYTLSSAALKVNRLSDLAELATLKFDNQQQCSNDTGKTLIEQKERLYD